MHLTETITLRNRKVFTLDVFSSVSDYHNNNVFFYVPLIGRAHIAFISAKTCKAQVFNTSKVHLLSAAWTSNRGLLVASRVKAFSGRPTNSDSTLHRATHIEGGVIGCHQCITSHSESSPASPDMRPTPTALSRMHAIHHIHPCPHLHPCHHLHPCPHFTPLPPPPSLPPTNPL